MTGWGLPGEKIRCMMKRIRLLKFWSWKKAGPADPGDFRVSADMETGQGEMRFLG